MTKYIKLSKDRLCTPLKPYNGGDLFTPFNILLILVTPILYTF
jgi:hypothetical protein